jgi:hypothetical protein
VARDEEARIVKAVRLNIGACKPKGADDPNRRICLGSLDHVSQTLWENPGIAENHLAVLARWREVPHRKIPVSYLGIELRCGDHPYALVTPGVILGNF